MTHVAFLNDVIPVSGGAERLLAATLLSLDPDRFERTLIVTRWDPAVAHSADGAAVLARLARSGVHVVGALRRSRISPRTWTAIARRLHADGVDVLHSHKFGANVAAAGLGLATGIPVIAHEHGLRSTLSRTRRLADRHLIGRAARLVLCVSEPDFERLVGHERLPAEKVRLLRPGVAPVDPQPPRRPRCEDRVVLIAVAELRPEKRFDLLLRAFARADPDATLVIVGHGPERSSLEALAGSLGLGQRVRFLGRRGHVTELLASADIGVLCSDREGTPLALMEYMQAGLAIAATHVGGIPGVVSDGREGLLVPAGAVDDLARALRLLCGDSELRRRLGQAARARCEQELGIERYVRSLEGIYESLATRERHSSSPHGTAIRPVTVAKKPSL